jgi:hypothetical protein
MRLLLFRFCQPISPRDVFVHGQLVCGAANLFLPQNSGCLNAWRTPFALIPELETTGVNNFNDERSLS